MIWEATPPTKEGFYWWCDTRHKDTEATIVYISQVKFHGPANARPGDWVWSSTSGMEGLVRQDGHNAWYGPLECPPIPPDDSILTHTI